MTDTERSLLDVVLIAPTDDLPRRVMADWYDENGASDRAAFIRTQIELAKHKTHKHLPDFDDGSKRGDCWFDCSRCRLERQIHELWPNLWEWFPGIRELIPQGDDVRRYISRGWPLAVALSMSEFMGGECVACNGRGEIEYETIARGQRFAKCGCDKGRVPGLCATLGRRWPIASVTLSDCSPFDYDGARWGWFRHVVAEDRSTLPNELWSRITGHNLYGGEPSNLKWFPDRADAMTALSDAAVDLMRSRASLPPLYTAAGSRAASAERAESITTGS